MGETKDLQMELLEEKKAVSLNVLEAATIARVGRSTICEELASGRLSRSSHENPCASRMVGSFAKEVAVTAVIGGDVLILDIPCAEGRRRGCPQSAQH